MLYMVAVLCIARYCICRFFLVTLKKLFQTISPILLNPKKRSAEGEALAESESESGAVNKHSIVCISRTYIQTRTA